MRVACLDFETANADRGSVCSVGVAIIEDGAIAATFERLVKPHRRCAYFDPLNVSIHGIHPKDVAAAPEFDALSPWLFGLLRSELVVAHNAAFDISVLRAALNLYELPYPEFEYFCTYRAAARAWPELPNHRLDTVSAHVGHRFAHHQAGADAEAAGRVLLAMLERGRHESPQALATSLGLRLGRLFHGGHSPFGVAKPSRRK